MLVLVKPYPTPGIMSSTRAVDMMTHAMSPDWTKSVILSQNVSVSTEKTYIVVDVEVLVQRVAACATGCPLVGHRTVCHAEM